MEIISSRYLLYRSIREILELAEGEIRFKMMSTIMDLFQSVAVVAIFVGVIFVMVREDLKEKPAQRAIENESEKPIPVIDVRYFESMSADEKYREMVSLLDRAGKQLASEPSLDGLHECLVEMGRLQRRVDEVHGAQQARLDGAIAWLEKPLEARGKFGSAAAAAADELSSIREAERSVRSMARRATAAPGEDPKTGDDGDGEDSPRETAEPRREFGVPDAAQVRQAIGRLRTTANVWCRRLLHELSETCKVWLVVAVLVRRSVFNEENMDAFLDAVASTVGRVIAVQATVDRASDVTTVGLNVFPDADAARDATATKGWLQRLLDFVRQYAPAIGGASKRAAAT